MAFDLAQRLQDTPAGGALPVPAGTYAVNLTIERPVRLIAMGPVVLDGTRSGPVLTVACEGEVILSGFLIAGGDSPQGGGGLRVLAGQVQLSDCTFRHNAAALDGGGALLVAGASKVIATRCRFEANTGRQGGAVLVDEEGSLVLSDSLLVQNAAVLGGALRVKEGARATLTGCTIADNKVVGEAAAGAAISLGGSSSRAPSLHLSHCVLSEREPGPAFLHNSRFPGELSFERCLLPAWCQAQGGDATFAQASYALAGAEPYLLTRTSPGVAEGLEQGFPAGAKDLLGRPRLPDPKLGRPSLGAYANPA